MNDYLKQAKTVHIGMAERLSKHLYKDVTLKIGQNEIDLDDHMIQYIYNEFDTFIKNCMETIQNLQRKEDSAYVEYLKELDIKIK